MLLLLSSQQLLVQMGLQEAGGWSGTLPSPTPASAEPPRAMAPPTPCFIEGGTPGDFVWFVFHRQVGFGQDMSCSTRKSRAELLGSPRRPVTAWATCTDVSR